MSVASKSVDMARVTQLGRELLEALGEDPDREGLEKTPHRWAKWWKEFIEYDRGNATETTFSVVAVDQLVIVSGIKVWSLCEHHLLPFSCVLSIGYLADKHLLGLSKFGRIAQSCAHTLQIQERLVTQIADAVKKATHTEDVAVVGQGEHLCMTMRGAKMPTVMTSSVISGRFREEASLRAEMLELSKGDQ